TPNSIFTKVDLPAPFSPSRAWISPPAMARSMRSQALNLSKYLLRPRTSSSGLAATFGAITSPPLVVHGRAGAGCWRQRQSSLLSAKLQYVAALLKRACSHWHGGDAANANVAR